MTSAQSGDGDGRDDDGKGEKRAIRPNACFGPKPASFSEWWDANEIAIAVAIAVSVCYRCHMRALLHRGS